MFNLLKKIKKAKLNQAVARMSDKLLYGTDFTGPVHVSINVENNYLDMRIKADLSPVLYKDSRPVSVAMRLTYLLPHQKYNPINVGKYFNNCSSVFVEEFKYNSRKSQLNELTEEQFNTVKKFCQRVIQRYFVEYQTVYSHALDALCTGKSFDYSQEIKLKVSRYSEHNSEWRYFRYKRYTELFGVKLDFRKESPFDEGYNIGLMRNFKKSQGV